MCPACIATATLMLAGVTSAGGLTALVVKKIRSKTEVKGSEQTNPSKGKRDENRNPADQDRFGPGWEEGCPSCSFLADYVDGALAHLAARDVTFVAVSRAPLAQIGPFQRRMGWRFKWVSSCDSDFNYDFHVSSTTEERAKGRMHYNYGEIEFDGEELPGASAFYKDTNGAVFHTYSSYARGGDLLIGAYNWLDLAPKGRDEDGLGFTMAWVRHHDRYGRPA